MAYAVYKTATGIIQSLWDVEDGTIVDANLLSGEAKVFYDATVLDVSEDTHYVVGGTLTAQTELTGITESTTPFTTGLVNNWTLSGIPVGSAITVVSPIGAGFTANVVSPFEFTITDTFLTVRASIGCEGLYTVIIDSPTKLPASFSKTAERI